jgi:hypothetical protein
MSLEDEGGLAAALEALHADAAERAKVDKAEFVQIRMKVYCTYTSRAGHGWRER